MRRMAIAVVALLLLVLSGYAVAQSSGADPEMHTVFIPAGEPAPDGVPNPPLPDPGEPDMTVFSNPLGGDGVTVTEVHEGDLAFQVDTPDALGTPVTIAISPPDQDPVLQEAVWVFNDAENGTFAVVESVAFETQAELESLAQEKAGCEVTYADDDSGYTSHCSSGGASLVKINGGIGLLIDPSSVPAAVSQVTDGPASDTAVLKAVAWIEPLIGMPPSALEGHAPNAVLDITVMSASGEMSGAELLALARKV